MFQANYKKQEIQNKHKLSRILREGILVVTVGVATFLFLALVSYHATDPGWSRTGSGMGVANIGGYVGAWFADVLLCIFGYVAYVFPFMLIYAAWIPFLQQQKDETTQIFFILRSFGFFMILLSGSSLADLHLGDGNLPFGAGGVFGNLFQTGMVNIFNVIGANLVLFVLFLTGTTLFSGLSWIRTVEFLGQSIFNLIDFVGDQILQITQR
ncbi:MAG: hypothetical protein ACD_69C00280G0004, partial [uncultured bacterium]